MTKSRRGAAAADVRALWASAIAGAVLFAVLLSGIWQFMLLQRSLQRQADLARAASAQHDALLQIVNEEAGIRGYVATGDNSFLSIYYASRRPWMRDAIVIAQTQTVIPRLEPRIRKSAIAALAVQRYFQHEIALVRAHRLTQARAGLRQGKLLVDRLRALDAAVQRDADTELATQRAHTRFLTHAGLTGDVGLSALLLVWLTGFIFLLRRARSYRLTAMRDPLTGAQNRRGALAAIDSEVGAIHPQEFGLVFIDLDGFKKINDVYGHASGDAILREVTARLSAELRANDSVCRLGGDEFVCVIAPPAATPHVRAIAERLRRAVNRPYSFGGDSYVVGCSVGISMFPQHGQTAEILLARADSAMYVAKAAGGGVHEATAAALW